MALPSVTIADAKREFQNYRIAMNYIDARTGRETDSKSGYFDISVRTLQNLLDEMRNNNWENVRVYNGMDTSGARSLLVSGLTLSGGRLLESTLSSTQMVKVNNISIGGSECPRWCDITQTILK